MHSNQNSLASEQKCIALVGQPNAGKTTLYNWLTASKFKTVNYPGATVEYYIGSAAAHLNSDLRFMDTPGTYSLQPKAEDEEVTVRAIFENPDIKKVDGVLVVVDATQLERHLTLVMQIKETKLPFVIVVTMGDMVATNNLKLDAEYLSQQFGGVDVVLFDGLLGAGLFEVVKAAEKLTWSEEPVKPQSWTPEVHEAKLKLAEEIADRALVSTEIQQAKKQIKASVVTQKIDQVFLHGLWGILSFALIMTGLFASVFWLAAPFMDYVDGAFGFVMDLVSEWGAGSLWADFLANGIIGSLAAFMVFVPQIFILFLAIGILEGSGYLSRAVALIDRPFEKLGMSGRSFVPLLSGFACAVPAIIATRNIPSKRDRLITSFIIPLMSCSARLPVFALFIAFLFHDKNPLYAGLAMAALYIGSIVIGVAAAAVVSRFIPKTDKGFLITELPLYRAPKVMVLLRNAWTRTLAYIKRAGPIIFVFATIIWVGSTFPHYEETDAKVQLEESYVGQLGQVLEPVFEPMGADWRVGIGLISAFAAREVFVSSLALTFNITDEDEESQQSALLGQMAEATNAKGDKIFTVSSVIGLMVFFLIALQCISTVGVQIREMGSWKFAMIQMVTLNVAAYIITVGLVQGLRLLGVP